MSLADARKTFSTDYQLTRRQALDRELEVRFLELSQCTLLAPSDG